MLYTKPFGIITRLALQPFRYLRRPLSSEDLLAIRCCYSAYQKDLGPLASFFKSPEDIPYYYRHYFPVSYGTKTLTGKKKQRGWIFNPDKHSELCKKYSLSAKGMSTFDRFYKKLLEPIYGDELKILFKLIPIELHSNERQVDIIENKEEVVWPTLSPKIGLGCEPSYKAKRVLRAIARIDKNTNLKKSDSKSILYAPGWSMKNRG